MARDISQLRRTTSGWMIRLNNSGGDLGTSTLGQFGCALLGIISRNKRRWLRLSRDALPLIQRRGNATNVQKHVALISHQVTTSQARVLDHKVIFDEWDARKI